MRKRTDWAAVLVWVTLVVFVGGCQGPGKEPETKGDETAKPADAARKAEEARLDAERATKLTAAIAPLEAGMPASDRTRQEFASLRARAPAKFHADMEQLEKCAIDQAVKAAVEKRYSDVAVPAIECLNAMQALIGRARKALIARALADEPTSPRDGKIETALMGSATSTYQMAATLVTLMLDYGPQAPRLSTFEAIASRLPPADSSDGEVPRALLQRGYAGENVPEQKEKMAARMKELAVPLEPAKASPTPAAR